MGGNHQLLVGGYDVAGEARLLVRDHELAREILRRTGPMAVSSANISGKPAALTCDEAIEQLGDSIAIYLDGGPLQHAGGAPSTIVDFSRHEDGQVLRRGAINVETLRQTAPNLLDLTDEGEVNEAALSTGSDQDQDGPAQGSGRDEDGPAPGSGPNPASGG